MIFKRFSLALFVLAFGISTISHAHCELDHTVNSDKTSVTYKASQPETQASNQSSDTCPQHCSSFGCVHNLLVTQQLSIQVFDTDLLLSNSFKASFYKQDFFPKLKRPPRV